MPMNVLQISPQIATLVPRAKTYQVEDISSSSTAEPAESAGGDFIPADKIAKEMKAKEEEEQRQFLTQIQRDVGKIIRKEECTEFMKQNEVRNSVSLLSYTNALLYNFVEL